MRGQPVVSQFEFLLRSESTRHIIDVIPALVAGIHSSARPALNGAATFDHKSLSRCRFRARSNVQDPA
jgi:hypothetical protein